MNVYVCHPNHFIALAAFAASRSPYGHARVLPDAITYHGGQDMRGKEPEEVATYYANLLSRENIRSVKARYPGSNNIDKPEEITITGRDMRHRKVKDPVHLLKMCDCLEYQSCETTDYKQSSAYALLNMIRAAAIYMLPGYDIACWHFVSHQQQTTNHKEERHEKTRNS